MWGNMDQINFEYGHFLRSDKRWNSAEFEETLTTTLLITYNASDIITIIH